MQGLFFAPAAVTEIGQLKALNGIPKWVSGAMKLGSLKDDTVVAEATIAVCPDGSKMSRLKRTQVKRLGASVDVDVSAGFGAQASEVTNGVVAVRLETGVVLLLPFD